MERVDRMKQILSTDAINIFVTFAESKGETVVLILTKRVFK